MFLLTVWFFMFPSRSFFNKMKTHLVIFERVRDFRNFLLDNPQVNSNPQLTRAGYFHFHALEDHGSPGTGFDTIVFYTGVSEDRKQNVISRCGNGQTKVVNL